MGDSPRLRCAGGASAYLEIMFTPLHMVVLLLLLLSTPLLVRRALAQRAADTESCVVVGDEARYRGLGYDHIVYVRNVCDHALVCEVRTDVGPDVEQVQVAPAAVVTVTTFRGSPAATFQPAVTCEPVS